MSEELKPVNCGCGGEAKVDQTDGYDEYQVYCPKCFMSSGTFNTEAEAIQAWNKAMGADKVSELMEHIWRDKPDTREKIADLVERMLR